MTSSDRLLADIAAAPQGPEVAAFFDMDGTLLSGFTAYVFAQDRIRSADLSDLGILREALAFRLRTGTFESLLRASGRTLAGRNAEEVERNARDLFDSHIAALIYPESRALVEAHRAVGHRVILISAATSIQVGAVADAIGFDTVICNRLVTEDGVLTGDLEEPLIHGDTKAQAARRLAEEIGVDLGASFAYADGVEDVPLLSEVGHARPLNPDRGLADEAGRRGWDTVSFDSRGRPPLSHVARTFVANAAMIPSVTAGLMAGAWNRDKRQGLNLALSTWGEFAVALSGVQLDVVGEKYIWGSRPCIFMFNHQSNFDGLLLMKLLRRDITAIAKKQLASVPLLGSLFTFGDVVFVDRTDREQAVAALRGAVSTLEAGISIAIAPEGTRQPTIRLGAFKRGGFHLAAQSGVPIVPIVIHNSHDVMPRGTPWIRPALVRVTVLEPVLTSDWDEDDLDTYIADVRALFLATLGQSG